MLDGLPAFRASPDAIAIDRSSKGCFCQGAMNLLLRCTAYRRSSGHERRDRKMPCTKTASEKEGVSRLARFRPILSAKTLPRKHPDSNHRLESADW